jgi:integrase
VRDWEANPSGGAITVSDACDKFMADAAARNLSEGMLRKLRHVTNELKEALGSVSLRSVSVDDVRKIREGWDLAPITTQKRLEMLRSMFRFCVDSGWIDRNPAKGVRLPVVKHKPTLLFTDEDMEKILWAADIIREIHWQMKEGVEKKLRTLILLMRYSGLRISDAVTLTTDRTKNGKLFLYQAKTDEPVWVRDVSVQEHIKVVAAENVEPSPTKDPVNYPSGVVRDQVGSSTRPGAEHSFLKTEQTFTAIKDGKTFYMSTKVNQYVDITNGVRNVQTVVIVP